MKRKQPSGLAVIFFRPMMCAHRIQGGLSDVSWRPHVPDARVWPLTFDPRIRCGMIGESLPEGRKRSTTVSCGGG